MHIMESSPDCRKYSHCSPYHVFSDYQTNILQSYNTHTAVMQCISLSPLKDNALYSSFNSCGNKIPTTLVMQVKIFCRTKKVNRMHWALYVFYCHTSNSYSINMNNATYEAATQVLLKIQVFWDITPCHWVGSSQHCKGHSAREHEGTAII
jgi:hypothetical protein